MKVVGDVIVLSSMRRAKLMLISTALMIAAASSAGPPAVHVPKKQLPPFEWADARFKQPSVDVDEWRDEPVRHRYVHGEFKGTELRFSMYFPAKEQYQGRFFQQAQVYAGNEFAATRPLPRTTSDVTQQASAMGFALASGAYFVETNNGYKDAVYQSEDPTETTVIGYRADAVAAQYSRVLAAEMYGPHRPYGYRYGGSGGSLKTICGVENTAEVWDGSVPYVTGTTMAMPNVFTIGAHTHRLLEHKWPAVVDALDPGGSGDMYAGLNKEEREALREATRLGFPPRTWFAHDRLGYGPLGVLIDKLVRLDPDYFEDFWKVPGYLGANPPESLQHARIQHKTIITKVIMSDQAQQMGLPVPPAAAGGQRVVPAAVQLKSMPAGDLKGASLLLRNDGILSVSSVSGSVISLGITQDAYPFLEGLKVGDAVQLDNSAYLAAQTYHRHQVPGPEFYGWDQYRGPDGKPLYPQRPRILGPDFLRGNGGCVQTGFFNGKMILVQTLMDEYAFPWSADWYRAKAERAMGTRLDDNFRLWFVDNAMHGPPPAGPANTRIVQYTTVLHQALRDLSAWVEKGIAPPASSVYRIVDGQVEIPATAAERKGVQPVVTLTANGGARADVVIGQPVTFSGVIEVPPGTGKIVGAQWDFEGTGDYPVAGKLEHTDSSGGRTTTSATHSFSRPGTYFPALRVASHRSGDATTPYARIENLGRARVVVK